MLFKLKHWNVFILCLLVLTSCQTRRATESFRKPIQSKEQIKADKNKAQKKEAYLNGREKARQKHYNRQATSTKNNWDKNTEKSNIWIKNEFHHKSLSDRVRSFLDSFRREPKPDEGLFSKKQKRRSKGNLFQRIFKKKKRKK